MKVCLLPDEQVLNPKSYAKETLLCPFLMIPVFDIYRIN